MAHILRDTHTGHVQAVDDEPAVVETGGNIIANIIGLIGGIIIGLLGLRFLLMLFGANSGNGIVDFIYSASRPFVAPFFGIFNYDAQLGVARFEFETLVAIAVYALITWGLIRLLTLSRR